MSDLRPPNPKTLAALREANTLRPAPTPKPHCDHSLDGTAGEGVWRCRLCGALMKRMSGHLSRYFHIYEGKDWQYVDRRVRLLAVYDELTNTLPALIALAEAAADSAEGADAPAGAAAGGG